MVIKFDMIKFDKVVQSYLSNCKIITDFRIIFQKTNIILHLTKQKKYINIF
jgi:hypothetical protein